FNGLKVSDIKEITQNAILEHVQDTRL
ncbi:TPA: T3SS effector protein Map, partial [Escherichia coli]